MFCPSRHQYREKELLDLNLSVLSINIPTQCESIVKSFFNDLNFHIILNVGKLEKGQQYEKNEEDVFTPKGDNIDLSSTIHDAVWRSAIDSQSGRKYYYDEISRKTQWNKPVKLKMRERRKKKEQMRSARKFFDDMEKNILNSMARGEVPGIPFCDPGGNSNKMVSSTHEQVLPTGNSHVRTISGMHDVLAELTQKSKIHKRLTRNLAPIGGRPPLPGMRPQNDNSNANGKIVGEKSMNNKSHKLNNAGEVSTSSIGHARRNTGGTIYLQNSMTNPNIKATIKCVCAVFRAHIVQSTDKRQYTQISHDDYRIFDDNFGSSIRRSLLNEVPNLTEILEFYVEFYQRSQMEHDTIITSLIYAERVIKLTNAGLVPTIRNWRSLLFSTMILSSKVWDDLSMLNVDFSNVTAHTAGLSSFTLSRINELELALLKCLQFNVKIPAGEYAKYYFLIRNMILKSGLVKESDKPLGEKEAFQKFESFSSPHSLRKDYLRDRRKSKSMDGNMFIGQETNQLKEVTRPSQSNRDI